MAIIGSKRPRHQPSTIDRLDPETKKLIADLRIDHGWTHREIKEKLVELGASHISKSALGRHMRTVDEMGAEMAEAFEFARSLQKGVGSDDTNALSDINGQLLAAVIMKLTRAANEGVALELGAKEVVDLARANQMITKERGERIDVITKAEERGEAKEKKKAAERAVTAARAKGLSRDSINAIRTAVLGSDA